MKVVLPGAIVFVRKWIWCFLRGWVLSIVDMERGETAWQNPWEDWNEL